MSQETPETDPLLRALRALPTPAMDPRDEARARYAARAAYAREFEPAPWHGRAASRLGRAVVPVALATVVGIYLTWAIGTASALMH